MKRAFLFGLSISLIITGAVIIFVGHAGMPRWGSTVVGLVSVLGGGIVYWKAKWAESGSSWLTAIIGWILGYCAAGIFYIPIVYVSFLLSGRPH